MTSNLDSLNSLARLKVKVVPGSSQSEASGWLGDMLKVSVAVTAYADHYTNTAADSDLTGNRFFDLDEGTSKNIFLHAQLKDVQQLRC